VLMKCVGDLCEATERDVCMLLHMDGMTLFVNTCDPDMRCVARGWSE
jgi:hypothetical protein